MGGMWDKISVLQENIAKEYGQIRRRRTVRDYWTAEGVVAVEKCQCAGAL
jgi:hypothetical protein